MLSKVSNVSIQAISSFLPNEIVNFRQHYSPVFGEKRVNETIRATGVEQSHKAGNDQTSSDLCYEATLKLLSEEQVDISSVDGLIFVSQTADYIMPSTSVVLQNKLGLSKDVICIDIHYGCSGYVYGLLQAVAWIKVGMCR